MRPLGGGLGRFLGMLGGKCSRGASRTAPRSALAKPHGAQARRRGLDGGGRAAPSDGFRQQQCRLAPAPPRPERAAAGTGRWERSRPAIPAKTGGCLPPTLPGQEGACGARLPRAAPARCLLATGGTGRGFRPAPRTPGACRRSAQAGSSGMRQPKMRPFRAIS